MASRGCDKVTMNEGIHLTAVVDPGAQLHESVQVGPYAVIGPHVVLGEGTKIGPHSVLDGRLEVGRDVCIAPFTCIGFAPQDKDYDGSLTGVRIGARSVIREFATIHRGTQESGWTTVGEDSMVMAYCHIGHDCTVGSRVVMANGCTLAGHVNVADDVTFGGLVAVHQFSRIGRYAFLAANSMVERDVPPFCRAAGDRASLSGLNVVGLRRGEFAPDRIAVLRDAYRHLFRTTRAVVEALRDASDMWPKNADIVELVRFVRESDRGICR